MIVPNSIKKRINSVFGPPSTLSPFISWAGGDGNGGNGGSSKRKIDNNNSFNFANTMTHQEYVQLTENLSSSDSDSDDSVDDFLFGCENFNPFESEIFSNVEYTSKKQRGADNTDINEESIMQPFVNADGCNCGLCTSLYNNGKSHWVDYYDKDEPTPIMEILKDSEKKEYINNNCNRLLSIFKDFDNGKYRWPEPEASSSSASSSIRDDKKKKNKNKDKININNIPAHILYVAAGGSPKTNEATEAMFWLLVNNVTEYAQSMFDPKRTTKTYFPDRLVYDDDNELYLGGIKYNGELVKGNKKNVLVMVCMDYYLFDICNYLLRLILTSSIPFKYTKSVCIQFEEMGYECWKNIDGVFQKLKIVNDIEKPCDKDGNSMRFFVERRLRGLIGDEGALAIKRTQMKIAHENNLQQKIKRIEKLPSLQTMDPHYVPFYELSKEERDKRDGNVTEDEIQRFEKQFGMMKLAQENVKVVGTKPRAVSCIYL